LNRFIARKRLMENMNLYLFELWNAGPGLNGWPLYFAIAVAEYLIYVIPAGLAAGWLWGSPQSRSTILAATLVGFLALGINQLINLVWFHPRPFMMHVGHTYLAHAPDSSFPSDHVTLLWTVGLVFVIRQGMRLYGAVVLFFALLVAWARVYLGVHFPLDMVGAILVATVSVVATRSLQWLPDRYLLPFLERLYRATFARAIAHRWVHG
jgi:undecaprenyl-diphosphatase